jgi:hypothetical protein
MWNAWPQTSRPISVTDKNMYLCKKQCSNYDEYVSSFDKNVNQIWKNLNLLFFIISDSFYETLFPVRSI